jgi:hypothetical protein
MATTSAGTYNYTVCKTCPQSGGTYNATSVTPPYPVYTGGGSDAIIQTQMVALGGFNGLNS